MAHLHLGLLAYWVVNTIRHQLKKEGIHSNWPEIVRTMNTQKAVTDMDEVIMILRCLKTNPQVRKIYDTLKSKYPPLKKKKSVEHKSELHDCQFIEQQSFPSG
jgi:hypothetical protein